MSLERTNLIFQWRSQHRMGHRWADISAPILEILRTCSTGYLLQQYALWKSKRKTNQEVRALGKYATTNEQGDKKNLDPRNHVFDPLYNASTVLERGKLKQYRTERTYKQVSLPDQSTKLERLRALAMA